MLWSKLPKEVSVCRCEGIWGGRESPDSWVAGMSNRGRSPGDCDSRSSTEFRGMSGLLWEFWLEMCCGESFLFFVEDVVNASCLCSSVGDGGWRVARKDWKFP